MSTPDAQKLSRLIQETPLGVIEWTPDLVVTEWNPVAERLFGWTRAEAVGRHAADLIVPEEMKPRLHEIWQQVLRDRTGTRSSNDNVTKSGQRIVCEWYNSPLLDDSGAVTSVLSLVHDITERLRVEEAVRRSEERYRELFENANDVVFTFDLDGYYTSVNRAAEKLLGYSRSEAPGLRVLDTVAPEYVTRTQDNLRRWRRGEVVKPFELEAVTKDGRRVPIELSCRLIHEEGTPPFVQAIGRDTSERRVAAQALTDRKRADLALRESERSFRALLGNVQMVAAQLDPQARIEFCNEFLLKLCGYEEHEVLGKDWFSIFTPPEERERQRRGYLSKVMQAAIRTHHETELLTRSGARRLISWNNTVLRDAHGTVSGTASLGVDITESRRAEAALRQSEERYALAAQGANDGLWDWDLEVNRIYFSPRWKAMLGYGEDEIGNRPEEWLSRIHEADARRVDGDLTAHLDARTPHLEAEHRLRHRDGSYRWVLVRGLAVRDANDQVYRLAGSMTDITERKVAEEKLLHDALHDALTGLPNRALLLDRMAHALARLQRRKDALFAVLFLDIDRFKMVNDSLGHMMGDQLLVAVARRLEAAVSPSDTVARLGGDEFILLLEDLDSEARAAEMAERIQAQLAQPFDLNGQELFTTASIGIAIGNDDYFFPEEMVRDADTAMYRAKAQGRSRHALFQPSMHAHAVALLQLESALRRAVEREEFSVGYQPIVSLQTGRLAGLEALLRWKHPQRGLISPAEFIPMAEETGLIVKLGEWVLRKACLQTRALQQKHPCAPGEPPLSVSVNLSVKQFLQPDLVENVRRVLTETGLPARSLHLEITESVIMENSTQAAALLRALEAMEVRVHLDDFGTGYSSLAYLHNFRMDALKIDRSFVSRMGKGGENSEVVRTIVHLARDLTMEVIAEGVETAEQVAILQSLRCEYGQGFYFAQALDVPQLEELLASRRAWSWPKASLAAAT